MRIIPDLIVVPSAEWQRSSYRLWQPTYRWRIRVTGTPVTTYQLLFSLGWIQLQHTTTSHLQEE